VIRDEKTAEQKKEVMRVGAQIGVLLPPASALKPTIRTSAVPALCLCLPTGAFAEVVRDDSFSWVSMAHRQDRGRSSSSRPG